MVEDVAADVDGALEDDAGIDVDATTVGRRRRRFRYTLRIMNSMVTF